MRLAAGMCVCTKAMMSLGASSPQKRACDSPGMAAASTSVAGTGSRTTRAAQPLSAMATPHTINARQLRYARNMNPRSASGASLLPEHY